MLQHPVSDLLAGNLTEAIGQSFDSLEAVAAPISYSSMSVDIASDAPATAEATGIDGAVLTALEAEERIEGDKVRRSLVVCIESWEKPDAPLFVGDSLDGSDKAEAVAELVADFRSRLTALMRDD